MQGHELLKRPNSGPIFHHEIQLSNGFDKSNLPKYVLKYRKKGNYLPLSSHCSNRFKMFFDFDIQVDGLVTSDSKT